VVDLLVQKIVNLARRGQKKALEQEGGREGEQDAVDYDDSSYAFLREMSHESIDELA
jgi:hypothetical protein